MKELVDEFEKAVNACIVLEANWRLSISQWHDAKQDGDAAEVEKRQRERDEWHARLKDSRRDLQAVGDRLANELQREGADSAKLEELLLHICGGFGRDSARAQELLPDVKLQLRQWARSFADKACSLESLGIVPSKDFSQIRWGGETFTFSGTQAAVVARLIEEYVRTGLGLRWDTLAESGTGEREVKSSKLTDLFKGHRALNTFIVPVEGHRGVWTIALPKTP